jgi:hypothetical protein
VNREVPLAALPVPPSRLDVYAHCLRRRARGTRR